MRKKFATIISVVLILLFCMAPVAAQAQPVESGQQAAEEGVQPDGSAEPDESALPGESPEPSESLEPSESPQPSESAQPSESPEPSASPEAGESVAPETQETEPVAEEVLEDGTFVTGEVLVIFEDHVPDEAIADVVEEHDVSLLSYEPEEEVAIVEVPEDTTVSAVVEELSADPDVKYAQPNFVYELLETDTGETAAAQADASTQAEPLLTPNDPYFTTNQSTYMSLIKAEQAWDVVNNDQVVKVAVIDTGAQMNHPDLVNRIVDGRNLAPGTDAALTGDIHPQSHGTHVAGIIAAQANNGVGVAGVAYNNARIIPINVFYLDSDGEYSANTYDIYRAVDYAVGKGAKVINMSLGGYGGGTVNDSLLESALNSATAQGVVCVGAGGNGVNGVSTSARIYPADYDACISVVPVDAAGTMVYSPADFNAYKDIFAPGMGIYSTIKPSTYGGLTGSSMAAPVISGTVALMLAKNPSLSVSQVKTALYSTSDKTRIAGSKHGVSFSNIGIVNALAAVNAVGGATQTYVRNIGISLSASSVQSGSNVTATANITPSNATNKSVTWGIRTFSDSTGRATITQSGVITATYPGKVMVTARAKDGGGAYYERELTIVDTVKPTASGLGVAALGNGAYRASVTAKDNIGVSTVTFQVISPNGATRNYGGAVLSGSVWYADFGNWDFGYAAGRYTVKATVRDVVGNTATAQIQPTIQAISAQGVSLRNEAPPYGNTAAAWASNVGGAQSGISQVRFAVWSAAGNQDDLVWYDGFHVGSNNWIAQVNMANHKNRAGEYYMHTYAYDNAGNAVFIGAATASLGTPPMPIQAQGVSLRNESPPYGNTAAAWAGGVVGGTGGIGQVRFALWSTANQDDLVWYDGFYIGNNSWIAQVNIANHKYRTGAYYMHTYAYDNAGNAAFVGSATVSLGAPPMPIQARGVSLRNENPPHGGTAAAWAGGVTGGTGGIGQVRFAVWSTANQDDLVWYDGFYIGENNWIAQVNMANHKNRAGKYYMHTYAYDNAGNAAFIGGSTVNLG